jgi:hypothetical protein
MAGYVAGGLRLVSDDVAVARRAACEPCARRTEDWKCLECGCHLLRGPLGTPGKTTLPREACPLGRWPAVR